MALYRLLYGSFRQSRHGLSGNLKLFLGNEDLMNRIECARAVISDQHWRTAAVILRQDLRAATTSAVAIVGTHFLIAQVLDALRLAQFSGCALLLFSILIFLL